MKLSIDYFESFQSALYKDPVFRFEITKVPILEEYCDFIPIKVRFESTEPSLLTFLLDAVFSLDSFYFHLSLKNSLAEPTINRFMIFCLLSILGFWGGRR